MSDKVPKIFGENLRRLRKERDWSGSKLGEELGGISKNYVSDLENGKYLPSRDLMRKIEQLFDTTESEMMGSQDTFIAEVLRLARSIEKNDQPTVLRMLRGASTGKQAR